MPLLPISRRLPSTVARRPRPGTSSTSVAVGSATLREAAAATTPRARGCSERASAAATARRSASGSLAKGPSGCGLSAASWSEPVVRVPVLSQRIDFILPALSSSAASRTRIPASAPRPIPTITAVGVASPIAHGQATTRTAMAVATARTSFGSAPKRYQPIKVRMLIRMIVGTKISDMRSASRAMAGFDACAFSTAATIRASVVPSPTAVARITSDASVRSAPATTRSPSPRSTGADSPVRSDSSIAARPLMITPSTGTRPPGRTSRRSPAITLVRGTLLPAGSLALASSSALSGRSARRLRTALVEASFACASSQRPSATNPRMSAAASQVACAGTPMRIS